jgi:hypothetical protein
VWLSLLFCIKKKTKHLAKNNTLWRKVNCQMWSISIRLKLIPDLLNRLGFDHLLEYFQKDFLFTTVHEVFARFNFKSWKGVKMLMRSTVQNLKAQPKIINFFSENQIKPIRSNIFPKKKVFLVGILKLKRSNLINFGRVSIFFQFLN